MTSIAITRQAGKTATMYAAASGHASCLELLLQGMFGSFEGTESSMTIFGADKDAKDCVSYSLVVVLS